MPTSPKKLLLSKWTALAPRNREKHFLVTEVIEPEDGTAVSQVALQAVLSGRTEIVAWRGLYDVSCWVTGWK